MPTEPSISRDRVFRFGPFELSEREGELRKGGVRIKLQEQPFRVLVELVANPGNLVSREDLHKKLWPADTFVDFDVGLNSAIRKLRQALNDDAENPRYIETLAKRGYRFMAPVDKAAMDPLQGPRAVAERASSVDSSAGTNGPHAGLINATPIASKRRVWIAAAVVVVAMAAGLLIFWRTRPPAVPIVEAVTELTDDGEPKP